MNEIITIILIAILLLQIRPYLYANRVIHQWAARNDFSVVNKQLRFIRVGPFFYHINRVVYKIAIKTISGDIKNAWMMIGDIFLLDPKRYEVVWEEDESQERNIGQKCIFIFNFILYLVLYVILGFLIFDLIFDTGIHDIFLEAAKKWD